MLKILEKYDKKSKISIDGTIEWIDNTELENLILKHDKKLNDANKHWSQIEIKRKKAFKKIDKIEPKNKRLKILSKWMDLERLQNLKGGDND